MINRKKLWLLELWKITQEEEPCEAGKWKKLCLSVCLTSPCGFQPCCCSLISGDFFHMPNWLHPKKLYNHHVPASWWGWECCSVYWQIVGMSLHHPSSYTVCFIDRCAVQQMNDTFALWWALVHTAGHPCGNSSLQFNSLQTLQKKNNKNSFPNHLCLWVHWNLLQLQKKFKSNMIWGKYVCSFLCCLPPITNCTQPCSSNLKRS